MNKKDLLELENKIEFNEKIIEKNEKTISENAEKIEEIYAKLKKYSERIKKNSFALEIVQDFKKENKFKNIIILIEAIIILGLAAIVIAHHWK
jgi:uncharacterized coiled-coil protein SlyX